MSKYQRHVFTSLWLSECALMVQSVSLCCLSGWNIPPFSNTIPLSTRICIRTEKRYIQLSGVSGLRGQSGGFCVNLFPINVHFQYFALFLSLSLIERKHKTNIPNLKKKKDSAIAIGFVETILTSEILSPVRLQKLFFTFCYFISKWWVFAQQTEKLVENESTVGSLVFYQ